MNILHKLVLKNATKLYERLLESKEISESLMGDSMKRVCDVGIGSGVSSQALSKINPKLSIDGIDIENALWKENRGFPIKVYNGNDFPLEDQSYDQVLIFLVLHHAYNPLKILQESKRISKKYILVVEELKTGYIQNIIMIIYDVIINLSIFGHFIQIPNFKTDNEFKGLFKLAELTVKSHFLIEKTFFKVRTAYLLEANN